MKPSCAGGSTAERHEQTGSDAFCLFVGTLGIVGMGTRVRALNNMLLRLIFIAGAWEFRTSVVVDVLTGTGTLQRVNETN